MVLDCDMAGGKRIQRGCKFFRDMFVIFPKLVAVVLDGG